MSFRNQSQAVTYGKICCGSGSVSEDRADADAVRNYALALDLEGHHNEAMKYYMRARDLNRESSDDHTRFRHSLYSLGLREYARKTFRDGQVIEKAADDSTGKEEESVSFTDPTVKYGDGGWKSPKAEDNAYFTKKCNIDRRDIATLSKEQFIREYHQQGRPVVLYGEGLIKGTAWEKWTREELERSDGEVPLLQIP
jgi:tetratricopeptide (TPR) repeat protein